MLGLQLGGDTAELCMQGCVTEVGKEAEPRKNEPNQDPGFAKNWTRTWK